MHVLISYHYLNCNKCNPFGHSRHATHTMMIRVLDDILAGANIPATRDCSFILTPPAGKDYIAPDLYVPEFPGGKRVPYDVSYTHVFDARGTPKRPASVLHDRYMKKNRTYRVACEDKGIKFIPFLLTTHACLHEETEIHIKEIAGITAENKSGKYTMRLLDRLYQYLSVFTMRSIADRFGYAVRARCCQQFSASRDRQDCYAYISGD